MNKPVYLGLLILELNKIVFHKCWHDYVKPKHDEKEKLCEMDTNSFIVYIIQMIFIKTLEKTLKQGLTLQIIIQADHYLKENINGKSNWTIER